MSTPRNRIFRTVGSVDEDAGSTRAAGQSQGPDAHYVVQWKRGSELPPFIAGNPAAVTLCLQIISGTAVELPAIIVSEAVAVQVYRLVRDQTAPKELQASGRGGVYVILASLACRALVAPDADKALQLDKVLTRKESGRVAGLDHALRAAAKQRARDEDMRGMDYGAATNHLLKRWDLLPLDFAWPTATGGGGGDPGGGTGTEQGEQPPPATIRLAMMDPRTRALRVACTLLAVSCRRTAEQRGQEPTVFAIKGGLDPDVLSVLNEAIRVHPVTHRAKRELSFEAKLVLARQVRCAPPLPSPPPILPIASFTGGSGMPHAPGPSTNPYHPSQP